MSKRIVIIGGGVIGLSAAWYCQQRGHQVIVVDSKPDQRDGCSFGNAGMIVPSHFIPLAAPGMIRLGLKWMWNRESPFYIRPRCSLELLTWLWRFKQACTQRHVHQSAPLLRDLHLASRQCFEQLQSQMPGGFGLTQNGLLMLCRTPKMWEEESHTATIANKLGVPAEILNRDATARLEPNIEMNVHGSVYYPQDCHLSPDRLMLSLQKQLTDAGCEFRWETSVTGFQTHNGTLVRAESSNREIVADEFVICSGVWSSELVSQLGVSLPMQAGKGYSMTLSDPAEQPSICSILTEARVAVTPIGSSLRFAGTMEIAGIDDSVSNSRTRGMMKSIPQYFPNFKVDDFAKTSPWVGLRPCSPDGLPYLGRTSRWKNLVIASGHAMMGISLATVSGKLVSELIDGLPSSVSNMQLLSPDRYG